MYIKDIILCGYNEKIKQNTHAQLSAKEFPSIFCISSCFAGTEVADFVGTPPLFMVPQWFDQPAWQE